MIPPGAQPRSAKEMIEPRTAPTSAVSNDNHNEFRKADPTPGREKIARFARVHPPSADSNALFATRSVGTKNIIVT